MVGDTHSDRGRSSRRDACWQSFSCAVRTEHEELSRSGWGGDTESEQRYDQDDDRPDDDTRRATTRPTPPRPI